MPKIADRFSCPACHGTSWRTLKAGLSTSATIYLRQRQCQGCGGVWASEERLTIRLTSIHRALPSTNRIEFLG